jgi:hypothetical protein
VSNHGTELHSDTRTRIASTIDEPLFREALESLPPLTRAVLLLSSRHELSYKEIGWCCGISNDEVIVRMVNALVGIDRYMCGFRTPSVLLRRVIKPGRESWAAARVREGDRRLGLSRLPKRRTLLDWTASALHIWA